MSWIEDFLEYTVDIPSPPIFRQWAAIAAVGGALERRVFAQTSGGKIYPNLFCLLVSPPGVGKTQAIDHVADLWKKTKGLYVAPKSVTKASLLDRLVQAAHREPIPGGKLELFHSLLVPSPEFGVLVPAHDMEFLNVLNDIYDNPSFFDEGRRDLTKCVEIPYPQLTILGGTQPSYLGHILPPEAWSMGFMSRVIMIHAGYGPQIELFQTLDIDETKKRILQTGLREFTQLRGNMQWTEAAQAELVRWHKAKLPPAPNHPKLLYYNSRRLVTVIKLMIIAAVADRQELVITESDVEVARDWMLRAEETMPDVFKDMKNLSDLEVIRGMHRYAWTIHSTRARTISREELLFWLGEKGVPTYRMNDTINTAVQMKLFRLLPDSGLIPLATQQQLVDQP